MAPVDAASDHERFQKGRDCSFHIARYRHQHLACPSSHSNRQTCARFSPFAARRSTLLPRATTFPVPAAAARQPIAPFRPASACFVRLALVVCGLGQWSIKTWELRYRGKTWRHAAPLTSSTFFISLRTRSRRASRPSRSLSFSPRSS